MKFFILMLTFFTVSNQSVAKLKERNVKIYSNCSEKYIFSNMADVTTSYLDKHGYQIKLEAYKTSPNDAIIEAFDVESFGKLEWVSIGHPKLVYPFGSSVYFQCNNQTLSARISMLEKEHTELLIKKIKSKFRHSAFDSLDDNQVIHMPLNEFSCSLKLNSFDNELILVGFVKNFREYPLKLYFSIDHFEKNKCEEVLSILNSNEQTLDCHASHKKKLRSLTVESNDILKNFIADQIFGNETFVYITHNQTLGIIRSWIAINHMGIENYDFDRQKINYLVSQLLNQVIVQEFNEIPYNIIKQQLTTYIFEPMPNDQTPRTDEVFLRVIRVALISKELFKKTLYFNKIQYGEEECAYSENFVLNSENI